jgi:hypothetical protein
MEKVVKIISLYDQSNDFEFWKSKTVIERLEAIEFLRKQYSADYDPASRLQRVLTVAKKAPR